MFIYNSLSSSVEKFKDSGQVNIYYCGPTVYNDIHIGNALSAVRADFVRRTLNYLGYSVKFAANWTDIDDKMIERASTLNISVSNLADKVIPMIESAYDKLNVLPPDIRMRATQHIDSMLMIIKNLIEKDIAYFIDGDGIYFDVSKFDDYGKLSNQLIDQLKSGVRVDANDNKRNLTDFVLWKFAKPSEPVFKDPDNIIPDGRPGWHIECSAMVHDAFNGETIDIHMGGVDLKFPHHECEIAQSESCFDKKFCNFWMHNGYLLINGEKMSKSLSNFKYAVDLFDSYSPLDLRFFMLSTQYTAPIEFTQKTLNAAVSSRYRIQNFYNSIINRETNEDFDDSKMCAFINSTVDNFKSALNNNFNVSIALQSVFDLISEVNSISNFSKKCKDLLVKFLLDFNKVFAVLKEDNVIPDDVINLCEERLKARISKDYVKSDNLRLQIRKMGFEIRDNGDSYEVY